MMAYQYLFDLGVIIVLLYFAYENSERNKKMALFDDELQELTNDMDTTDAHVADLQSKLDAATANPPVVGEVVTPEQKAAFDALVARATATVKSYSATPIVTPDPSTTPTPTTTPTASA